MDSKNITLLSFGYFEKDFLERVAVAVQEQYGSAVSLGEVHADLGEYYDIGRRQYNGNKLLELVDGMWTGKSDKQVGIFNVDLFIPILTYIYGQAYLGGRTAIASFFRLNNELYGMKADEELLIERFSKEVIHELGHTFGLIHCLSPVCVMRSSTYVEDVDLKEMKLCHKCRSQIRL